MIEEGKREIIWLKLKFENMIVRGWEHECSSWEKWRHLGVAREAGISLKIFYYIYIKVLFSQPLKSKENLMIWNDAPGGKQ
jgi:hypothetical protein